MTEKGTAGLTWERRLTLWLPRPLVFGVFLIVAFLTVAYLIFQWVFDLSFEYKTILLTLFIAFVLMSLRWELLADTLDRQRYGLAELTSERHEAELQALRLPHHKIRRSRLQGVVGILTMASVVEIINIASSQDLMASWTGGPCHI